MERKARRESIRGEKEGAHERRSWEKARGVQRLKVNTEEREERSYSCERER